jgi:hypothetical protein
MVDATGLINLTSGTYGLNEIRSETDLRRRTVGSINAAGAIIRFMQPPAYCLRRRTSLLHLEGLAFQWRLVLSKQFPASVAR